MKRFLYLPLILAFIVGCEKEPTGPELDAPESPRLSALQNGTGLKFEWDPVSEASGYYVYFGVNPDLLHAIYKVVGQTYFIHDSVALDDAETGYYKVLAVGGDYDSVVGPMSEAVRSAALKTDSVILYERDYLNGDSTAFGWDGEGNGKVYSINDAVNRWHFYLDDGKGGEFDTLGFKFVTPGSSVDGNFPPEVPWDTTYITGPSDKSIAPVEIEGSFAPEDGIKENDVFYLLIDGEHYAKIVVKDILENGVIFDAYFQDIETFRRF